MRASCRLISPLAILSAILLVGTAAFAKEVKIKWKQMDGAFGYQLEVNSETFDRKVEIKDPKQVEIKMNLDPGVYRHRLRARDKIQRPGEWSEWSRLVVLPTVPERLPASVQAQVYHLSWKPMPGVTEYDVEWKCGSAGKEVKVAGTSLDLPLEELKNDQLKWKVRARVQTWAGEYTSEQALKVPQRKLAAIPQSVAKPAPFAAKGYVAFSGIAAPYTYKIQSPSQNVEGSTESVSMIARLSGEYWFNERWGAGGGFEKSFYQINSTSMDGSNVEAFGKFRFALGAWDLAAKAGLEARDYFQVLPNGSYDTIAARGVSVGIDVRRELTRRLSLGTKAEYFKPMMLNAPDGAGLTGEASGRNFKFGAQLLYWFNERWSLATGTLIEQRSISFESQTPGKSENIYTDAVHFYSSLIYRFGR